jgi:hypothetical protein
MTQRRSHQLRIRVSTEEKERIHQQAKNQGLTVSAYVRRLPSLLDFPQIRLRLGFISHKLQLRAFKDHDSELLSIFNELEAIREGLKR